MKIAFITYAGMSSYPPQEGFDELIDLLPFLQSKGLDIHYEIWDNPAVEWQSYDVALLRTPWDYHEKFTAFRAWITTLEALGVKLLNEYALVRWNFDKHYLQEIAHAGYPTIPSVFLEKGEVANLPALFECLQADQLIIKPCVSASAHNTLKLKKASAQESVGKINELLKEGAYLAQPFMKEISEGEWSFVFFNGKYSHTILKKPQAGEFRIQQAFGGSTEAVIPPPEHIRQAAAYLAAFAPGALYARVDGLLVNGSFLLMELELIEPSLFLGYDAAAPNNFYQALKTCCELA